MGKVTEKVALKNFVDVVNSSTGLIPQESVKTVEIEAVVNTGAAYLCLPAGIIGELGLSYLRSPQVVTANGIVNRRILGVARITIQGRDMEMDMMENDEFTPPLVGYLVLQAMDFVVDLRNEKLIPNPAHERKWITDLL